MVDFLVIGPRMSAMYDNIFPLVKDRRIMLGSLRKDISFGDEGISCRWFQNIRSFDVEPLSLKEYKEGEYDCYDHFDAINIDKTKDIPDNYYGLMGVPVTFLDKWNPDQFDVIGVGVSGTGGVDVFAPIVEGDYKYRRILIRRKKNG